jgi:predicted dehydrogenase
MHANAIEKSAMFDLTAVCDTDENARNKAYTRFNCRLYEDYREMIETEDA